MTSSAKWSLAAGSFVFIHTSLLNPGTPAPPVMAASGMGAPSKRSIQTVCKRCQHSAHIYCALSGDYFKSIKGEIVGEELLSVG